MYLTVPFILLLLRVVNSELDLLIVYLFVLLFGLAAFVVCGDHATSNDAVEHLIQLLHTLAQIMLALDLRVVESSVARSLISVLFAVVFEVLENVLPVEVNL